MQLNRFSWTTIRAAGGALELLHSWLQLENAVSAAAPSDIDTGSALFIRETTLGFQMHMNYERIYLAQKMNEIEANLDIF